VAGEVDVDHELTVKPWLEHGQHEGAELADGSGGERAVDGVEDVPVGFAVGDQHPDDLTDEAGDRGGLDSLAGDVADEEQPPPVGHRQRVVEIATHLDLVPGRHVLGSEVDSGKWSSTVRIPT